MIPVGTKVYSFRDHPFVVLEGTVVEHTERSIGTFHICQWFDPILNQTYRDICFEPYLTKEDADKAHTEICDLLFKHRSV